MGRHWPRAVSSTRSNCGISAPVRAGSSLVVFSPDGKTLASSGRCNSQVALWDVTTGKQAALLRGYDAYGVRAMTFAPDGKTLVSVGYHDGIKLWDVASGRNVASVKISDRYVPLAQFTPDGERLAT